MKRWVLTRPAERDLDEAHLYLCEHASIETAARLREGIEQACDGLAEMPGNGEHRPEWTDRPVRFWLVEPYWVIYRADTDPLEIVRVLHAARDIPSLLEKSQAIKMTKRNKKRDVKLPSMSEETFKRLAMKEDGCSVSVGGLYMKLAPAWLKRSWANAKRNGTDKLTMKGSTRIVARRLPGSEFA